MQNFTGLCTNPLKFLSRTSGERPEESKNKTPPSRKNLSQMGLKEQRVRTSQAGLVRGLGHQAAQISKIDEARKLQPGLQFGTASLRPYNHTLSMNTGLWLKVMIMTGLIIQPYKYIFYSEMT